MISGQKYKLYLAAIDWEYFRPIGSFGSKLGPKEHDMRVFKDHSRWVNDSGHLKTAIS